MANGYPEIKIDADQVAQFNAEDELTLEVDNTTNASYVYYSQTYLKDAVAADKVWRCFRVTVANGSKRWAKDPVSGLGTSEFKLQASLAATYTY